MIIKRYCFRCHKPVKRETDKYLKKEYPYYCPHCDENMYSFEIYAYGKVGIEHLATIQEYIKEVK